MIAMVGAGSLADSPARAGSGSPDMAVAPAASPDDDPSGRDAHDARFQRLFDGWQSVRVGAEPVGNVTVSRAADALGRPIYAARQSFSGAARLVSFSTRRPVYGAGGIWPGALPGQMPLASAALTSGFGYRRHPLLGGVRAHNGIDLAAPAGTPIVATSDGTVSAAGWYGGYGLLVALDHGRALQTRYGHMSRLNVAPGQQVRRGDVIGFVGSTGRSTGPHLHYEVRANGMAVNPLAGKR